MELVVPEFNPPSLSQVKTFVEIVEKAEADSKVRARSRLSSHLDGIALLQFVQLASSQW